MVKKKKKTNNFITLKKGMEVKKWGKPVKGEEGVASHGVSWYDSEAMKCGIDVRRERERERVNREWLFQNSLS